MSSKSGSSDYYEQLYSDYRASEGTSSNSRGEKRPNYLSWKKFFMSVALLTKQRSKDPRTQVGACIVNPQNKIVGIGYNSLPEGCNEDEFEFWENRDVRAEGYEKTKYAYVCNAAVNAVLNKNAENLEGCTIYTTLFPSHEDAKMIIQAGIGHVVYLDDRYHDAAYTVIARKLLSKAKVWYTCYYDLPRSVGKPNEDVTVFPWGKGLSAKKTLSNEDYFMSLANLAAQRSKDPARQVGACIVNEAGKIVGIGYNGFPLRISDDDPDMSWGKTGDVMKVKYPHVVHAEVNAIMHKTCIDLKDCTLYTTLFPCNECVKVIIQAGIKEIRYLTGEKQDKQYFTASKRLLKLAGYSDNYNSEEASSSTTTEDRTKKSNKKTIQKYDLSKTKRVVVVFTSLPL